MDWKKYEAEIFENFKTAYPNAKIKFNQKIIGRYSKVERQIDVLIEERIAGKKIRLVIDGKYYSKNVDVKDVESFISMVEDIDAAQGILITSKGYSEAAINRAYYGPIDIELDILNFDELKQFQGFGGITYSGWHGAKIPAPFGWVVDGTRREGSIANIYQRGKSYEEATKDGEFIYVNILSFDENLKNLDDVLNFHKENTLAFHPTATCEYSDSIERSDKKRTLLRKILREETHFEEYTGFVEFEEFCVFCVLFTPEQLKTKNIRKLEYVIERLIPMNVDLKSVAIVRINDLRKLMEKSDSEQEKAEILIAIAQIHRDMKEFEIAKKIYEESIKLFPENYVAHLGLLEIGYNSSERDMLIANFYGLAPGNRQICDDIVRLGIENEQIDFTEKLLLVKLKDEPSNFESLGNIYFSLADLFYAKESMEIALKYFRLAKSNFIKCFEISHPALQSIENAIFELEK
ncbi:restriction endonuclease [Flavobacterium sp. SUN046]|uniref:restriction endonuclease n=1 Tax=Flavobacterium sp. SUN046 TaxID=3002440 RepID=UPI002DBC242A|nr:restriction endonuclease [Flavobacterium sp. SUN046]MEC4049197.1 restriction endonuclease [Flavobacterium sp. SUN046]